MFLIDLFSTGNKMKKYKKGKKKKKVEEKKIDLSGFNPIKEVKTGGFSRMGYGPKKNRMSRLLLHYGEIC